MSPQCQPINGTNTVFRVQVVVSRVGSDVDEGQERKIEEGSDVVTERGVGGVRGWSIGLQSSEADVSKDTWSNDFSDGETHASDATVRPGRVISAKAVVGKAEFGRQDEEGDMRVITDSQAKPSARFEARVDGGREVDITGNRRLCVGRTGEEHRKREGRGTHGGR